MHEASGPCGVGAEIAALIAEKAFTALKAPVMRITGPDVPPPAFYPLEQAFVPQADHIIKTVRQQLDSQN